VMSILTILCMGILMTIRPMTFPQIKGRVMVCALQYCGRNTLDIYVAHLLVFKVLLFISFALK
jgi:surface polysaccharide O-acyltransferase-like enzyme